MRFLSGSTTRECSEESLYKKLVRRQIIHRRPNAFSPFKLCNDIRPLDVSNLRSSQNRHHYWFASALKFNELKRKHCVRHRSTRPKRNLLHTSSWTVGVSQFLATNISITKRLPKKITQKTIRRPQEAPKFGVQTFTKRFANINELLLYEDQRLVLDEWTISEWL